MGTTVLIGSQAKNAYVKSKNLATAGFCNDKCTVLNEYVNKDYCLLCLKLEMHTGNPRTYQLLGYRSFVHLAQAVSILNPVPSLTWK